MDDYHRLQLEQVDTLSRRMSNILEKGFFSDCTIICKDRKWAVHRGILASSPYFKSQFSESKHDTITFLIEPPDVIQAIIEFLYTANYCSRHEISASPVQGEDDSLTFNVLVYALATRLSLTDLATLAVYHFKNIMDGKWKRQDFVTAADIVYTGKHTEGLRDIVLDHSVRHAQRLYKPQSEGLKSFQEVAEKTLLGAQLAYRLVTAVAIRRDSVAPVMYQCRDCFARFAVQESDHNNWACFNCKTTFDAEQWAQMVV